MEVMKDSDYYVWDIETDGLLDTVTQVWCMSVCDGSCTELFSDHDTELRPLRIGLEIISGADLWVGHNLIAFDWQVVKKLHPWVTPAAKMYDTLIMSRMVFAEPQRLAMSHDLPKAEKYNHSLKAWGLRLNNNKSDYGGGWDQYSDEMGEYCVQDNKVTYDLYCYQLNSVNYSVVDWDNKHSPVNCEHQFAVNIANQVETGFYFDESACHPLVSELSEAKVKLTAQLQEVFPPRVSQVQLKTKVRTDVVPFNPGSRIQIAERLQELGWRPVKFTDSTKKLAPHLRRAKVDPDSLLSCNLPQVAPILRYLEVDKRLGQLANGTNAWLKLVKGGKIHGGVNTIGAVTSRVSHNRPNMSAVPRIGSILGAECRDLFSARPDWSLVGADLAGIELRCLAHYTWMFDDGEYAEHVLHGDIHTVHQQAFGLPEGKLHRSIGKTGTYCLIYGGGDWKLGYSLGYKGTAEELTLAGKQSRARLMKSLPALKKLTEAIKTKKKKSGDMIRALDGRPLYCRSDHSALNTLLQSAAAIIAKTWYNLIHSELNHLGYVYCEDYETHGFFHDEVQIGCRPEIADVVGAVCERMAIKAGESLGFMLPVNADYKVGHTWKDTH